MKPVPPNANPSETIHLGQQSPLTRLLVEQAIVENVDKMAGLCCLRHSTYWNAYWESAN